MRRNEGATVTAPTPWLPTTEPLRLGDSVRVFVLQRELGQPYELSAFRDVRGSFVELARDERDTLAGAIEVVATWLVHCVSSIASFNLVWETAATELEERDARRRCVVERTHCPCGRIGCQRSVATYRINGAPRITLVSLEQWPGIPTMVRMLLEWCVSASRRGGVVTASWVELGEVCA